MHLYETATGIKILMNTDTSVVNVNEYLHNVYKVSNNLHNYLSSFIALWSQSSIIVKQDEYIYYYNGM